MRHAAETLEYSRDPLRATGRLGPPNARSPVRLRRVGAGAGPPGHHRRRRGSGPPPRHGGREDDAARPRCSGRVEDAGGDGLAPLDRADACRCPGRARLPIGRAGAINAALLAARDPGAVDTASRIAWQPSARRRRRPCWTGPIPLPERVCVEATQSGGRAVTVVGCIGGGQLGRMLGLAGVPLGLGFRFLDPSPRHPPAAVGELVVGSFDDAAALDRLAAGSVSSRTSSRTSPSPLRRGCTRSRPRRRSSSGRTGSSRRSSSAASGSRPRASGPSRRQGCPRS